MNHLYMEYILTHFCFHVISYVYYANTQVEAEER